MDPCVLPLEVHSHWSVWGLGSYGFKSSPGGARVQTG